MLTRCPKAVPVIALLLFSSCPVLAGFTLAGPTVLTPTAVTANGQIITLNPNPLTYLAAATPALQARLAAEFAGFAFVYANGGLNGTFTISNYEAVALGPNQGGGTLIGTYARGAGDPALADLRFIQLVTTNVPLGGPTSPYIDPRPNDDTLPFYWTAAEENAANGGNKGAGTYRFSDTSSRTMGPTSPDPITWRGELYLASFDQPNNTVTVYDGIRWGWNMAAAPEPGTVALLVAGLPILGVVVRRRAR